MTYLLKNPITTVLKASILVIKNLLSNLKYCLNIKKIVTILLFIALLHIVITPLLNFIRKLLSKKHNSSSDSCSSGSQLDKRKFRSISSGSSCSACKHNSASSSSSSSSSYSSSCSSSSSSCSSSSSSVHIDKKKVKNTLRKFNIIV